MTGSDLKIIIKKLQDNNIDLDTINDLLLLDERLLNKINLAKNEQDLNNIIKIILTNYPNVDDTNDVLNVYLNCTNKKIKDNITEILTNKELIQAGYNISLAKVYINKSSKYVYKFITNYAFYKSIYLNQFNDDYNLLMDCINEIYYAKDNVLAKSKEQALIIYIYKLANIIEYSVFKKFINSYELTNNENILELINDFLQSAINSLESLDNLSQIYNILLNSQKVIDDKLKAKIKNIYVLNLVFDNSLVDVENKNEILKIITSEKVNDEDIHIILSSTRYYNFADEIVSIIKLLYHFNCTEQDYEFLNKVLKDEKYNYYFNDYCKYLNDTNDNIPEHIVAKLYDFFHFKSSLYNNKTSVKKNEKIDKATKKRNKTLDEYINICDKEADNEINPSKLVRKK